MTREEKYDMVNSAETLDELANAIEEISEDGVIHGRNHTFSVEDMIWACKNYNLAIHNSLTREFGIRQQAMYILHYSKKK